MSDLLTDQLVRQHASALYHGYCAETGTFGLDDPPLEWIELSRAALEAVIPSLIEECAKVAEFSLVRSPVEWALRDPTPKEIATAIRSLIPSKENDNG